MSTPIPAPRLAPDDDNNGGTVSMPMPENDAITKGEIARRLDTMYEEQRLFHQEFRDFAEDMPRTYVSRELADERKRAMDQTLGNMTKEINELKDAQTWLVRSVIFIVISIVLYAVLTHGGIGGTPHS